MATCRSLPRVGVCFGVPSGLQRVQWYGRGPHECYPGELALLCTAWHDMAQRGVAWHKRMKSCQVAWQFGPAALAMAACCLLHVLEHCSCRIRRKGC